MSSTQDPNVLLNNQGALKTLKEGGRTGHRVPEFREKDLHTAAANPLSERESCGLRCLVQRI
jgi:hypothetical protein